jgi:hypothetical protein
MTIADLLKLWLFPRPLYGIWIPERGWLRGTDGKPYADNNKRVALSIAKRLQNGARVEYIDAALSDIQIERMFLSVEQGENNHAIS